MNRLLGKAFKNNEAKADLQSGGNAKMRGQTTLSSMKNLISNICLLFLVVGCVSCLPKIAGPPSTEKNFHLAILCSDIEMEAQGDKCPPAFGENWNAYWNKVYAQLRVSDPQNSNKMIQRLEDFRISKGLKPIK